MAEPYWPVTAGFYYFYLRSGIPQPLECSWQRYDDVAGMDDDAFAIPCLQDANLLVNRLVGQTL
jgi:hypothetical protein